MIAEAGRVLTDLLAALPVASLREVLLSSSEQRTADLQAQLAAITQQRQLIESLLHRLPQPVIRRSCTASADFTPSCDELIAALGVASSTLAHVLDACKAAGAVAQSITQRHATFLLALNERSQLLQALGMPAPASPEEPTNCVELENALPTLQTDLTEVRRLFAEHVSQRTDGIRHRLLLIRERFHLLDDEVSTADALDAALAPPLDFTGLNELEARVAQLEAGFSPDRARLDSEIARAIGSPMRSADLITIPWTAAASCGWEAGLLSLHLIQVSLPLDQPLQNAEAFVRTLAATVTAIPPSVSGEFPLASLLSPSFSPWLHALPPESLRSPALLKDLAGLLLAATVRSQELFALSCHLGIFDVIVRSERPTLARLADCVRNHRPYTLTPVHTLPGAGSDHGRSVETAVQSCFDSVVKHPGPLRKRLAEQLRPRVRALWQRVVVTVPDTEAAEALLNNGRRDLEKHTRKLVEETFFRERILEEIDRLLDQMRLFITASAHVVARTAEEVDFDALRQDCLAMGGADGCSPIIWDTVSRDLELSAGASPSPANPLVLLSTSRPPAMLLLPEFAVRWSGSGAITVAAADLPLLLERLRTPLAPIDALAILRSGHCWLQATALASHSVPDAQSDVASSAHAAVESLTLRLAALKAAIPGDQADAIQGKLAAGCYLWVDQQLSEIERRQALDRQQSSADRDARLKAIRTQVRDLQDAADESSYPTVWKAETHRHIDSLLLLVANAIASQATLEQKDFAITLSERAIPVLRSHIEYGAHDFALLAEVVNASVSLSPPPLLSTQSDTPDLSAAPPERRADRESLWQAFLLLERSAPAGSYPGEAILALQRLFAKNVAMYHSETDPAGNHASVAIRDLPYRATDTHFYKPGANHFAGPIRIYTCLPGDRGLSALASIRTDLETTQKDGRLNVLLVLRGIEEVRRHLESEIRAGLVTLIDRSALRSLLANPRPWAPLRQAMRRTISLESASPFRSEGHVEKSDHLYVGRNELRARITDGRCWAIWGGRRSGKTSLLHDVKELFRRRRREYYVAYRSLETLPHGAVEELDLRVARSLGSALGWTTAIASLEDFEVALRRHCEHQPTCLLLDEMDAYVRPHLDARSTRFPLIRILRGLRNELADKFVCIMAGFKYLYRAVKLVSDPDDSTYPWVNWLNATDPLGQLSIDETAELVREGFEDILGLDCEPTVPPLIFEKTAGHPAFVQYFCQCILRRLGASGRQDAVRVTEGEVRAVYADSEGGPGAEPFIRFVERTLDMNLSGLEKIVVYVLADMIGGGDARQWYPRSDVERNVNGWFSLSGRSLRTSEEFEIAFSYLAMTSMLRIELEKVRMSFPSYVDILRRLEELDRGRIFTLIMNLEK